MGKEAEGTLCVDNNKEVRKKLNNMIVDGVTKLKHFTRLLTFIEYNAI